MAPKLIGSGCLAVEREEATTDVAVGMVMKKVPWYVVWGHIALW